MKTLNLSRGTPVTVTFPDLSNMESPFNGTVIAVNGNFYDYLVEDDNGDDLLCYKAEVKIRYDNPKPFTLWCNVAQPMKTNEL